MIYDLIWQQQESAQQFINKLMLSNPHKTHHTIIHKRGISLLMYTDHRKFIAMYLIYFKALLQTHETLKPCD